MHPSVAPRAAILEPVTFPSAAAFRSWLARHHLTATDLIVRIAKARAGGKGIGYAEALDEARQHLLSLDEQSGLEDQVRGELERLETASEPE